MGLFPVVYVKRIASGISESNEMPASNCRYFKIATTVDFWSMFCEKFLYKFTGSFAL